MVETWYALLAAMLCAYLVLDGWNIGAGITSYAIGCDQRERRAVMRALGPSWSWHEVWLIAFGGTLFMAFPAIYAATFAGFSFAFFPLLWSLILRGVAIEVRGLVDDPLWRSAWDGAFWLSSTLLALLIGLAAGNVLRGVPLDAHGDFALPLFTDFGIRGQVGLIDWYTVAVALFTLLALGAHGASYIALRTAGVVQERAALVGRRLWTATLLALPVITASTASARADLFPHMVQRAPAWLGVAVLAAGAITLIAGLVRQRTAAVFVGGALALGGLVGAAAAAMFPVMLASTVPEAPSLLAYGHSATAPNLAVALAWWSAAAVLVGVYLAFVLRHDARVLDRGHQGPDAAGSDRPLR
jgi:cytochrome d ubiquinol oxidase subunit II